MHSCDCWGAAMLSKASTTPAEILLSLTSRSGVHADFSGLQLLKDAS